ncbi:MAG: hypothetical protein MJE68_23290, partial [Proteobacteria bacterium]|nr:hypothetical protein [Pseudomonadota bacterium]
TVTSNSISPYCIMHIRYRNASVVTSGKGDFYNGNPKLPAYARISTRMDTQEIVNAFLDPELDDDMICSMQPVNVENNVAFIVDLGKLKNVKDLYCDDMGSWQYNGVYHSWLTVDDAGFVSTMGKEKPSKLTSDMYYITKKYFVHRTSSDLKKIVVTLSGKLTACGSMSPDAFWECHYMP